MTAPGRVPSSDRQDAPLPGNDEGDVTRARLARYRSVLIAPIGTAAALLGAVSILWALLAPAAGLSLVVFATGSMSPTIPQGSLALARDVPAAELQVGSVAMLQRPGEQPVSHRVLAVETDPAAADSRLVTMQGDDNPVPDPEPYRVKSGRVIIAALPGGASVLAWVRSPPVMGALAAGATTLVLWSFWPTGRGANGDRADQDDDDGARPAVTAPARRATNG